MKHYIYVDQDGPLADFDSAVNNNVRGIWQDDPPEMFEKGFFRNLPVTRGAKDSIAELLSMQNVELYVLSKPTVKRPSDVGEFFCPSEKYEWLHEHFPELVSRTFLACDKGHIKAPSDATRFTLIDDYKEKWEPLFQGEFLHFDVRNDEMSWKSIMELIRQGHV